jgi:hypothetical protein
MKKEITHGKSVNRLRMKILGTALLCTALQTGSPAVLARPVRPGEYARRMAQSLTK